MHATFNFFRELIVTQTAKRQKLKIFCLCFVMAGSVALPPDEVAAQEVKKERHRKFALGVGPAVVKFDTKIKLERQAQFLIMMANVGE